MLPRWRLMTALLLLLVPTCRSFAQDSTLYVYGKVGNYLSGMPAWPFAVVAVDVKDTTYRSQARANAQGRYELVLHAGRLYVLVYQAEGLLPKHVLVDTHGPSAAQWKDGFGLQLDMVLVPLVPGVDVTVLKEPVGRCAFNLNSGNFEWDRAYAETMRPRLAKLSADVDKALMPDSLLGPPVVGPERPAPAAPAK